MFLFCLIRLLKIWGYSETVMTALLAGFALAMFIANPILGHLSDKVGRQPVLLVFLIIGTATHLWFALSNDILSMFAARIIADNSKPEARARIKGFLGAAVGSGFVLGPAIGGFLFFYGCMFGDASEITISEVCY